MQYFAQFLLLVVWFVVHSFRRISLGWNDCWAVITQRFREIGLQNLQNLTWKSNLSDGLCLITGIWTSKHSPNRKKYKLYKLFQNKHSVNYQNKNSLFGTKIRNISRNKIANLSYLFCFTWARRWICKSPP